MKIRKVAIVTKPRKKEVLDLARELEAWFQARGVQASLPDGSQPDATLDSDLLVVLGGDGTLLAAARLLDGRDVPILGINYGGLGFLTAVTVAELYGDLERVLAGQFKSDRRMMLEARIFRGPDPIAHQHALNDVVIHKGTPARIVEVEASVDGQYVSTFRADGLIVATPTGSTAYNLSAGGPIVHPFLDAVLITPICSHTLTNRPLILPASVRVSVTFPPGDAAGVSSTIDGQVEVPLEAGDRVEVSAAARRVRLIAPEGKSYFEVLREKLKWG